VRGDVTAEGHTGPVHDDLLNRLRGAGRPRPPVDPSFAGGLREWLEDALAPAAAGLGPGDVPARINKQALTQVLTCEAHLVASRAAPRVTVELVRGILVDALFRQWMTVGMIGDAMREAMDGCAAAGGEVGEFVAGLAPAARTTLADEVADQAARIVAQWPVPPGSWLARTQERLEIGLCGGRILMSGVIDLAFGSPAAERASTCLVDVKSGRRRVEHRADLHFYALLETLRSGAPPFMLGTYYAAIGELDTEPVEEGLLVGALRRVVDGSERLCRLASGEPAGTRPNPLCPWCVGLDSCAPGQEYVGAAAS
jgi:hypothetical protein